MNPSGGNDFHGKNSPPRPGCGGGGGGGGGGDNNIHLNLSAHHRHPQQQFLLPSSSSSQNNYYANLNAPPASMLDESSSIMRLDHTRPEPAGAGLSSITSTQTTTSEKSGAGKKHTTTSSSAADDDVKTMDPKRRKLDLKLLSKAHHQKKSVRFAARADQNSRNLKNSPPQPFLHPQEEESSSSNDSSELSRSKNETHVFRRKQETRKLCAELLKNSPQKIQDYQTLFRLCEERSALAGDTTTSNSSSKSKSKPSSPSSLQRAKASASGSVLEILGRIQQADDDDNDDGDENHCCCRGLERLLLPACQETRERHLRAVLELQAQTPPNVEPELKSRILRAASLKFSKSSRTFAKLLARSDHLLLAAPASATQVSKKT